jgi:hypothetical protein
MSKSLKIISIVAIVVVSTILFFLGNLALKSIIEEASIGIVENEKEDKKEGATSKNTVKNTVSNNTSPSSNTNTKSNNTNTKTNTTNATNTTTTNSNTSSNNSNTKSNITGKKSSKDNLLSFGEWGMASKSVSGGQKSVPVRINSIIRGNEAGSIVKEAEGTGGSISLKYTEPKKGMEWVVVNYTVDVSSIMKEDGVSVNVVPDIQGTGESKSITYNGLNYTIIGCYNIGKTNYVKTQTGDARFATQLPIGCTEYVIVMGYDYSDDGSGEYAYFKGQ